MFVSMIRKMFNTHMPVTREQVVAAYKKLLGRLPESDATIDSYLAFQNMGQVHAVIQQSAEYRARNAPAQKPRVLRNGPRPDPRFDEPVRIVFVGNCQALGLAALCNAMHPQVQAVGYELSGGYVADLQKQRSTDADWRDVDAVWAHPHPDWAQWLAQQPAEFAAKVRTLPTIDTLGFHPDCAYVSVNNQTLKSPTGAYHSALVLWAYGQGYGVDQTLALFREDVFRHLQYFDYADVGVEHLVTRSFGYGVPVADWLPRWHRRGVWMHTINHPKLYVLSDVALFCLQQVGLQGVADAHEVLPDGLALSACWPVYPPIAQALGVEGSYSFKCESRLAPAGKSVHYLDLREFVERSLAIYARYRPHALVCDRLQAPQFVGLADWLAQAPGRAAARGAPGAVSVPANPYAGLPDHQFWRRSVERVAAGEVDPVTSARFHIGPHDKVATAGSCFAQHISRTLAAQGFHFLVTERADHLPVAEQTARNYGVFSARFGNVYTARQLRQLQAMALGVQPEPEGLVWQRPDGRWVDGLRPYIEPEGFASPAEVHASRRTMLACVGDMLRGCDVLVFTLGLTEAWHRRTDGAVVPVAPGVVAPAAHTDDFGFVNFSFADTLADMQAFLWQLKAVNPRVKVVLTVSPVPLVATYENRSVVASTAYSKAVLRAVAGQLEAQFPWVAYFASYEVITNASNRGRYFETDLRSVTDEGVAHVMRLFMKHFAQAAVPSAAGAALGQESPTEVERATQAVSAVVCDEERLDVG